MASQLQETEVAKKNTWEETLPPFVVESAAPLVVEIWDGHSDGDTELMDDEADDFMGQCTIPIGDLIIDGWYPVHPQGEIHLRTVFTEDLQHSELVAVISYL